MGCACRHTATGPSYACCGHASISGYPAMTYRPTGHPLAAASKFNKSALPKFPWTLQGPGEKISELDAFLFSRSAYPFLRS